MRIIRATVAALLTVTCGIALGLAITAPIAHAAKIVHAAPENTIDKVFKSDTWHDNCNESAGTEEDVASAIGASLPIFEGASHTWSINSTEFADHGASLPRGCRATPAAPIAV